MCKMKFSYSSNKILDSSDYHVTVLPILTPKVSK